jgi:acyl carrier protein
MNKEEIFELIKEFFVDEFEIPEDKINPKSNLFEDLDLDSIDALDMVGMLESKLDIEVEETEIADIRTIEDVINFILKKTN